MNISMTDLALVSLYAAVLGVLTGAAFDVVRIGRVALGISSYGSRRLFSKIYSSGVKNLFDFKRSCVFDSVAVGVGDVLFFLFAAVSFSIFLYRFNYGRFRWFILFACVLGFLAYYFSIGRLTVRFSDAISQLVMLAVNLLIFVLVFPFKAAGRLIVRLYGKSIAPVVGKIKITVDKVRRKRYTYKCIKKIPEYINFKM